MVCRHVCDEFDWLIEWFLKSKWLYIYLLMHHFVVFHPNYKQRDVEEDFEMINENEGQLSRGTPN
jgi:hypothetical protein